MNTLIETSMNDKRVCCCPQIYTCPSYIIDSPVLWYLLRGRRLLQIE